MMSDKYITAKINVNILISKANSRLCDCITNFKPLTGRIHLYAASASIYTEELYYGIVPHMTAFANTCTYICTVFYC